MCLEEVNLTARTLNEKCTAEIEAYRKMVQQSAEPLNALLKNAKFTEPCGSKGGKSWELFFIAQDPKATKARFVRIESTNEKQVFFIDNTADGEGAASTEAVKWECKANFVRVERSYWESRDVIYFDLKNGLQIKDMDGSVWSPDYQSFFRPNKHEQYHPLEFYDCKNRSLQTTCQPIWSDPSLKGPIRKVNWGDRKVNFEAADDFSNDDTSHKISIFKLECSWNEKFQCQKTFIKKVADSEFYEVFKK